MRSVFDGGAGEINPGTFEKLSDSGERDLFCDRDLGDVDVENGGEACKPVV